MLALFAGQHAQGWFAPRGFRMFHADRLIAFAAAVWMINRVHSLTSDSRTESLMAVPAGFAQPDISMIKI